MYIRFDLAISMIIIFYTRANRARSPRPWKKVFNRTENTAFLNVSLKCTFSSSYNSIPSLPYPYPPQQKNKNKIKPWPSFLCISLSTWWYIRYYTIPWNLTKSWYHYHLEEKNRRVKYYKKLAPYFVLQQQSKNEKVWMYKKLYLSKKKNMKRKFKHATNKQYSHKNRVKKMLNLQTIISSYLNKKE